MNSVEYHNQVISYNQLNEFLPCRDAFIDKKTHSIIDNKIKNNEEIMFLPTYIHETLLQDIQYEKYKYKIVLMGVLQSGKRATFILDNIKPYFEVRIPSADNDGHIKVGYGASATYYTESEYIYEVRSLLNNDSVTKPTSTIIVKGKPFRYFQEERNKFLRFYYDKIKSRAAAIKLVRKNNYETTHDDMSNYPRVVCRDYLATFSSWSKIAKYKVEQVDSIKGLTFRTDISDYKPVPEAKITPNMLKDKTLSMCWDIETYDQSGDIPKPENLDASMPCIGITFQWVNEQNPFLKIALCDLPAKADPNHLTVICGKEENMFKAFGDIFEKMSPEFICGFNDSDYDWNWLITRAKYYPGSLARLARKLDSTIYYNGYTDDSVLKFSYKKENVKIAADISAEGYTLMMPGYIPVDVRTCFRRLYPTAEKSSLKWFLEKNKLGSKEDMPYKRMFRIYRDLRAMRDSPNVIWKANGKETNFTYKSSDKSNKKDMSSKEDKSSDKAKSSKEYKSKDDFDKHYENILKEHAEVNKYCVVDALRCHDLLKIRNVFMNGRELSNMSYCSMFDSIYRADGMKVRNLTIAEGQQKIFNIKFTNITSGNKSDKKYPGAYVVPPKKGLKTSKLTIEERIKLAEETKNKKEKLCQEWINTSEEEINKFHLIIEKHGPVLNSESLEEVEKEFGPLDKKSKDFFAENIGRPITGLDFSSLYPSLVRAYNLSPEYCVRDRAYARRLSKKGIKLTKVKFPYGTEIITAWFVHHNNQFEPYLDDEDSTTNNNNKSGKATNDDVKQLPAKKRRLNPDFRFGVYPYILNKLFAKRKVVKNKMKDLNHKKEKMEAEGEQYLKDHAEEYENICFDIVCLDSKQKAIKVFMNTFYGEAGNQVSPFFLVEVAGGITSKGQENIKRAKHWAEQLQCITYYGDSVAENTPILIKLNDEMHYCEIRDLVDDSKFQPTQTNKEIAFIDCEVWSDNGWTKLKHVIRHKTNKKMYRVLTHTSSIDVTEDHSLLDSKGKEISPNNNLIGVELLAKNQPIDNNLKNLIRNKFNLNDFKFNVSYKFYSQIQAFEFIKTCEIANQKYHIDLNQTNENNIYIRLVSNDIANINVVKKIIELPNTTQYVYDIETENHHFGAGIGNLIVHNTDSIYISIPEKCFAEHDKLYYTGKISKLEYWTRLVEETFKQIKEINKIINVKFFENNGTYFLSMAYEEVLYPVIFTAKKKYFGIPHENIVNFNPKDLFVRGLEVKKRGVSVLLRKIFNSIMWKCVDPNNLYTPLELVHQTIDDIYSRDWELKDFIQTDVFRPAKKNVKVHTFVRRMKERNIEVPSNERFEYVMVKKYPYKYDYRGRKTNITAGDKMEFPHICEEEKMSIDLDYYMQGSINGQLGRLVTYHEMFHVEPIDNTNEELKIADDKVYKNACKYVDDYCKQYYSSYNTFGKAYQKMYKTADSYISGGIKQEDELAYKIMKGNINVTSEDITNSTESKEDFANWFVDFAEKDVKKEIKNTDFGVEFLKSELKKIPKEERAEKIKRLQKVYYNMPKGQSIIDVRKKDFDQTMSILRRKLRENSEDYMMIFNTYQKSILQLTDIIKNNINLDQELFNSTHEGTKNITLDDLTEKLDTDVLNKLDTKATETANSILSSDKFNSIMKDIKTIYLDIKSAYVRYERTNSIVERLKSYRNKSNRIVVKPNKEYMDKIRNEDTNDKQHNKQLLDLKL